MFLLFWSILTMYPIYLITLCVIQGYYVYYTLKAELPLSLWTIHKVENSRMTSIGNLLTNRTYTLTVQAYTLPGKGPLSERKMVKTTQGGT